MAPFQDAWWSPRYQLQYLLCLMNLRQYCLSNALIMDNGITRGKVIQVPHLLVVQVDTVSCNLAIIGSDKSVNDLEIRVFERFWR